MSDSEILPRDLPFPGVSEALWAWLLAACPAIARANGHRQICEDLFVKVDSDRFERKCRERTVYDPRIVVHALNPASISKIDAAIGSDPVLRELRNRYVGGAFDLFQISAARFAQFVIPTDDDYENRRDLSIPDPANVERLLRGLDAVLHASEFEIEFITPIWGLEADRTVQLEDGLTIERITDDDALRLMRLRVLIGDVASYREYRRMPGNDQCLRRRVQVPLRVLDAFPLAEDVGKERFPDAIGYEDVDTLLGILPLVSTGSVLPGPTVRRARIGSPWSIESKSLSGWSATALDDLTRNFSPVQLTDEKAHLLEHHWRQLKSDPASGALSVAMRRLRFSADRRSLHDRMLDLMIAAEALFIERGNDHDELRFRASLNAAFFLESEAEARKLIFHTIRGGYDARSAIAHGDEPEAVKIAGHSYDLKALVPQVENVIRRALQKRLNDSRGDVDWLSLAVGS
ncbi:MAG: hypothetical protein EPN49_16205 [Rhodanobacter sp.]|nr:MAG: hypothetical protein EPN49_16205 [Rhodanobacter sp.]